MADHSSRRRDERLPSTDGETPADEQSAGDRAGETLAEKIHRFRQPGPGAAGGASGPGSRVVRHPRED
jgi:hypothetical protein